MHGEPGGVTVPGAHEVLSSAVILTSVTPLSVPDINIIISIIIFCSTIDGSFTKDLIFEFFKKYFTTDAKPFDV